MVGYVFVSAGEGFRAVSQTKAICSALALCYALGQLTIVFLWLESCYFQSGTFRTCILHESVATHFVGILISSQFSENKLIFSINVDEDAVGI